MDDQHLAQLLEDYFNGSLSPEDKTELEQMLLQYPAARETFWECGGWEALYEQWGGEYWGREGLKLTPAEEPVASLQMLPPPPRPSLVHRIIMGPWLVPLSAAAVITVLATWGLYLLLPRSVEYRQAAASDPRGTGVAVLRDIAGVVWADEAPARSAGATLEPGWLRFKSGMVVIEFFSGARVLLEGPAELDLRSGNEAFCKSGRLRAQVPAQAHGFMVATSRFNVVDLGTAFGLQVSADGSGQVKVLQGQVELRQGGVVHPLKAGFGASVDAAGAVSDASLSDTLFPAEDDFQRRADAATEQRRREWRASFDEIAAWPALRAHFTFEPQSTWDQVLRNRAPGGTDGAIVGARWIGGRWARKSGLEFQSASDRVRFDLPGESDSMSLAAWVRVDALENLLSGLVMSDGDAPGGVRWGIKQPGNVALGVWPVGGQDQDCDSNVVFSPGRGSEWTHLAVVIDSTTRQVRHYVNGIRTSAAPYVPAGPLRIGRAEIGNWNDGSQRSTHSIRNLNGRVDEVMVFGRALKPEEVVRLWSLGRPEMQTPLP
jgi:Concanavalin A-like lectin/glucanases superfamily